MPLLSIIVPVYNVEKYLQRCLDSILSQTFRDFEVILVDDGSTDSSPAICDRYAEQDGRVRVFHKKHQGVGDTRRFCMEQIDPSSVYVTFVDSDDWIAPDMHEKLLNKAEGGSQIVYCDFYFAREDSNVYHSTFRTGRTKDETICNFLLEGHGGNLWNKLIDKQLLIDNKIIFKDTTAEDFIYIAECMLCAGQISKVDEALYYYNQCNSSSIMSKRDGEWKQKRLRDNLYVEDILLDIFRKHGMLEKYKKELIWREQSLASDWILMPDWHKTYYERRKMFNGDPYLSSNPFLHKKMKIAMWLLDHHITLPLRVLAKFNKS